MAAGCRLHHLHQLKQWRQTPLPLKSQSQTGAGSSAILVGLPQREPEWVGHLRGPQPTTSPWLSQVGSTTLVVVERGVPEERQPASHLTQGDRGVGWRGSGPSQPASSQTSSRPGLGISQKVKKSSVNTSCPGPAPFLAVKQPSLGLPHRLTYEAIFAREG